MSKIVPTIGRKLYFHPNGMPGGIPPLTQNDPSVPLDATIVYVWPSVAQEDPEYSLNLVVFDHAGNMQPMHGIPLVQDGETAPDAPHPYAEWMPFQVGQAKAAETEKVDAPNVVAQTAATSSDTSQPTAAPTPSASPAGAASAETGPAIQFDFGGALAWLKAGKRVARDGWNGKGMFIYLVPAAAYPVQTEAAKAYFGEGSLVPYNPYFAIKNVNNTVSTWVPSVNDCLADDWHVVD